MLIDSLMLFMLVLQWLWGLSCF